MEQLLIQTLISINLGIWILVAIQVIKIIWKIIRWLLYRLYIQLMDYVNDCIFRIISAAVPNGRRAIPLETARNA